MGAPARPQPPAAAAPQLTPGRSNTAVALSIRNPGEPSPPPAFGGIPVPIESANPYTQMQLHHYETTADLMNVENHRVHNGNPDYWDILVRDTESDFRDKVGLDFGCGCGATCRTCGGASSGWTASTCRSATSCTRTRTCSRSAARPTATSCSRRTASTSATSPRTSTTS